MTNPKSLLITFTPPPYLTQLLHNQNYTLYTTHQQLTPSITAIITNASHGANAGLIDSLPNLEIIASFSVGVDRIDMDKCAERGIKVTNTPDVLTDDVADLGISIALSVLKKMCVGDVFVRCGTWKTTDFCLGTKFSGKSVGILGLGRIGSAIAKRAEAFGCSIRYCSRSKKLDVKYKHYEKVTDLAANCDILFVSCSLTEETRHIINREVIDALGPKGVLINIGRGAHIVESELVSALVEGRLGGAGLDVFENEPNVPEELFGLDNVVLQSHVGSDTVETCDAMADLVVRNLEAHSNNRPLLTPVI